jgi:hypothetical protein
MHAIPGVDAGLPGEFLALVQGAMQLVAQQCAPAPAGTRIQQEHQACARECGDGGRDGGHAVSSVT